MEFEVATMIQGFKSMEFGAWGFWSMFLINIRKNRDVFCKRMGKVILWKAISGLLDRIGS